MTSPFDDPGRPLFTMGQVADLLDVQQAFLRRLESHDLITPSRSEGNQRRYSRDEIDRVSDICGLVGEGLTLAGVRRVLDLQAEVAALKAEIEDLRSRRSGR
ncbi:MAG TPA: MerR family transcriptional regulator [Mycobacteriales bacterium]